MFEKFSDRARRVLTLARQEAQRTNSEFIGSEHLLLAIIEEGSGVGAKVLRNLNIDLMRTRQEIENLITPSTSPTVTLGQLPFSPRAKQILDLAYEAAGVKQVIGTEHLLLALFIEKEGIAGQVLRMLGVTEEGIRKNIQEQTGKKQENAVPATPTRKVSIHLWLFKPLESATANMTIVVEGARYELSQIIPIQEVAPEQVALIAQGLGSKVYLVELVK